MRQDNNFKRDQHVQASSLSQLATSMRLMTANRLGWNHAQSLSSYYLELDEVRELCMFYKIQEVQVRTMDVLAAEADEVAYQDDLCDIQKFKRGHYNSIIIHIEYHYIVGLYDPNSLIKDDDDSSAAIRLRALLGRCVSIPKNVSDGNCAFGAVLIAKIFKEQTVRPEWLYRFGDASSQKLRTNNPLKDLLFTTYKSLPGIKYVQNKNTTCIDFMSKNLYPQQFIEEGLWFDILIPGSYILEVAALPLLSEEGDVYIVLSTSHLHRRVIDILNRRSSLNKSTHILIQSKESIESAQKLKRELHDSIQVRVVKCPCKMSQFHAGVVIVERRLMVNVEIKCLITSFNFSITNMLEHATLVDDRKCGCMQLLLDRIQFFWDNSERTDTRSGSNNNWENFVDKYLQLRKKLTPAMANYSRFLGRQVSTHETLDSSLGVNWILYP